MSNFNLGYMFNNNLDYKRRDELIFGDACPPEEQWAGGIRRFSISPSTLKQLLEERFINPEDSQNDSPTAREFSEFFQFVSDPEEWRANGYAVSHDREDYRVSIEGCESNCNLSSDDLIAFTKLFRSADEFELEPNRAYCWFD